MPYSGDPQKPGCDQRGNSSGNRELSLETIAAKRPITDGSQAVGLLDLRNQVSCRLWLVMYKYIYTIKWHDLPRFLVLPKTANKTNLDGVKRLDIERHCLTFTLLLNP